MRGETAATPKALAGESAGAAGLRRSLSLFDLILYGIVIISPVSPAPFFGILTQDGRGHAPTAILIAMLAMLPTAISYGRMAYAYPSAGSAFVYVGRELTSALGYLTGWAMLMDYLLAPLVSVIWMSEQAHILLPTIPYGAWVTIFAAVFTALTSRGIAVSAKVNAILTVALAIVVGVFVIASGVYIATHARSGIPWSRPFYDPKTWEWSAVARATSLAMLTYIGFDAISTLAEETRNPRRNVPLATVLTCVAVGAVSILEVYAGELVWPAWQHYPNLDTAFTYVAQRAWAPLYSVMGMAIMVSFLGVGISAQIAVARLMYCMGRSRALPPIPFGMISPATRIPRNNILIVGVLAWGGAITMPVVAGNQTAYDLGANLVNFGALLAFMGVNLAAFVRYFVRASNRRALDGVVPAIGFVICLMLWCNLSARARVLGLAWTGVGVAIGALRTGWFRNRSIDFDAPDAGL